MSEADVERIRKKGRQIGTAVFGLLIGSFTIVAAGQVLAQGFFSGSDDAKAPPTDCREGLRALSQSLRRASEATENAPLSERARLERFRNELRPEWQGRDSVAKACKGDPWTKDAFSKIDRLRWAEEHAVRYESADLARSRQLVSAIEKALGQQPTQTP